MDNDKLYDSSMIIMKHCESVENCHDCFFYSGTGECRISFPKYEWQIPKPRRWTDEDIALAKALKVFGVKEIYNGIVVYPPKRWAIDTDEGVLPQRAFANLSAGERISIDDIIKEGEDGN